MPNFHSDNHYEVLGVSPTSTPDEIKRAYRTLMIQYHPDKHDSNPKYHAISVKINAAYEFLKNNVYRKIFDAKESYKYEHRKSDYANSSWNEFYNNWSYTKKKEYQKTNARYKKAEKEVRDKLYNWFYEQQKVKPKIKYREYSFTHKSRKLNTLISLIQVRLGDILWHTRIRNRSSSSREIPGTNVRFMLNPCKVPFREVHHSWVINYY